MRGTKAKAIRKAIGYKRIDSADQKYFKNEITGQLIADKDRMKYQAKKGRMKL